MFLGKPTHGSTGWIVEGEEMLQVNYFDRPGMPKGWLKLDEFRRAEVQFRKRNYDFYKLNPQSLQEKIKGRNGRRGRSSYMSRYMGDLL